MRPQAGLLLMGRYQLRSRIALGGMGEVWRAWDVDAERAVAAKVLRPELAGQEAFLARLRAEARNSAGLHHPNIAALLDYGEQDGSGFLVMELVDGEPMTALLERRGTLPAAELLPVLAQVARGLHAAHAAGVVHRDVKPSNILLPPGGPVKITDFGISLAAGQPALTAAGMVMGTAQYLSPEQATGRPATPLSDLYALGIVAYEALAGRRPFTGRTEVEIAVQHVDAPVPPLPGDVPAPVRDVVARLLAKHPALRPPSGEALARELDRLARPSHAPSCSVPSAASAPRPGTVRRRRDRTRRAVGAVGVGLATTIGAMAPGTVPSTPGIGTLALPEDSGAAGARETDRTTARDS
ncbi:serine/threonine-protein kinase [Georgenia faecalis]|uniref:serine/threonine-protein kinase n=1 Tax=Georgenia faecalis TaxID=2483799 RepID=UPI0019D1D64B|nr:serine/threonine-protein kinase [Georgenia faecalis]